MALIMQFLVVGFLYYLGAYVGVHFTTLDSQISLLWPPNAILLSALLMSQSRHWFYFAVAALCAELAVDMPVYGLESSILFSLTNIFECLLIAGLIRKLVGLAHLISWNDPQKVMMFILVVLVLATPLAALLGASVNYYVRGLDQEFLELWQLWWLGDATGLLVLTPICLACVNVFQHRNLDFSYLKQNLPFVLICVLSLGFWASIFKLAPRDSQLFAITPFLIVLPVVLDLMKLSGQQKVIIAAMLALLTAILTSMHIGPLTQGDLQETALFTQEFIIIFICIIYMVSAYHTQTTQNLAKLQLFESAIKSAREGIVITEADNDQKIIFCNPAFQKLSGYEEAEILGTNCRFLNRQHPDQEELKRIHDAIQNKTHVDAVVQNTTKQGVDFWNKLSISPIKTASGNVTHFSGVQLDVTEKMASSRLLEEQVLDRTAELYSSQQRFELATSISGLGIWEWNLKTNELVWDGQMHAIYQTPLEVLKTGLFYDYWEQSVHPDDVKQAAATLASAVETHKKWDYEFRLKLADDSIKYIKATAIVQLDQDGKPAKMIGGNIDITKQRRLEEKLKFAVEEAKTANLAKSEFLANMSHEIRTPMNGVLGMSELLHGTELNVRQKEYVGMIESSAKSLLLLLNDILDLSKIEAGQFTLDPIPTCLDESVGDIMKGFAVTAHKKGLDLQYYIAPKVPKYVCIDRLRLGQILFNLVGNAVKFTSEGQVLVDISSVLSDHDAADDANHLKICVIDTGIGIPKDKQADIFKPFHQADNSVTREFGGTGLGLPIVVNLVRLMGGEISLVSEQGVGTQVELILPVERCQEGDLVEKPLRVDSNLDFTNLRILAVDDNTINQRWLKDMAQSWGSRIDIASSAKEGLAYLEAAGREDDPVSILITDKNMPELSGFDLVGMIQEKSLKRPAVIIMLSSSEAENDIKMASTMGIEEFILKPVKQSEVFNSIQNALGQKDGVQVDTSSGGQDLAHKSLNILVAEDNLVNQRVVHDILEPRGHKLTIVENGALAVSQAENNFYDIILMDVQMPVMGGFEATQKIRKLQIGSGKRSHIIGVTAHALKGDKELGLNAGMDGYLTKPVFAENLIKTVEQSIYDSEVSLKNIANSSENQTFFDQDKALQVTGNSQSLLMKMSMMTLELLPEMLNKVDACIDTESETEMKVHLHKLTGMVANLCSHDLVEQLKLLESNLNEILSTRNAQHWARLRTNIVQFQEELKAYAEEV